MARAAQAALPAPAWSTHATLAELPSPVSDGASGDPGVVRMAPVFVHGGAVFRQMDSALRVQETQARVRKSYARLGIGTHELRLRRATLFMVTMFDIPVVVGVSW